MPRPTSAPSLLRGGPRNRLLARLPDDVLADLQPYLKTVALEPRQILHRQGERLRQVYFGSGPIVSMASLLADGAMVEVATIGDDGIVGVEAVFADDAVSACDTIVQVPGPDNSAEQMSVEDFRRELLAHPPFNRAVARYVEILYAVMARLMACNAHHQLQERCARWLLSMHDRMHESDFHLSHEFLAAMLGVRRQSVGVVCGALRDAGLIRYTYGRVTVLDRKRLEDAACDCYPAVRALYDRLTS